MRKYSTALIGAIAVLGMTSAASAQTFSPSLGSISGYGDSFLSQGISSSCNIDITASMGSTSASIPTRTFTQGDLDCLFITPIGSWSMAVVPGSTTQIDLSLGYNNNFNRPCFGTVRADWDNTTKILTLPQQTLPPVNSGDEGCLIYLEIELLGLTINS